MPFRLFWFSACLILAVQTVWGQLPNTNGQVWSEYIVTVPPSNEKIFDGRNGNVRENTTPLNLTEYIRRQTGEAAWTGENFGLISYDNQKLYVYHTPAMQRRVAEIVERFMRPETRNLQFVTQCRFVTQPSAITGSDDIRRTIYQYLHPIVTPDFNPVCQTPGVSAYWVARDDIAKLNESLQKYGLDGNAHSNVLISPQMTTFNGQLGGIQDTKATPFVTDVVSVQGDKKTAYDPVITLLDEGTKIQTFSLLSLDKQTVTTDMTSMFASLATTDHIRVLPETDTDKGVVLQNPQLQRDKISENGLVWPTDGMLVVLLGDMERQQETVTETGVPFLSKVPHLGKKYKAAVSVQKTVYVSGILTVQTVNTSPQ